MTILIFSPMDIGTIIVRKRRTNGAGAWEKNLEEGWKKREEEQ